MEYSQKYKSYLDLVNEYLSNLIKSLKGNERLIKSMEYSLMAGGKRIRPVLCLACCENFGLDLKKSLPFACAVELVHTSSLVHDDLPALDNDDLRRGKPSNHKAFGEDIAILAGDALLNLAFEVLFENSKTSQEISACRYLANASGYSGMLGGQAYDLTIETEFSEDKLLNIHKLKTAKLIQAPIVMAGLLSGQANVSNLEKYGFELGLLFQYVDDLLDVIGDEKSLGKTLGKDEKKNKLTAISLYGIEGVQSKISAILNSSLELVKTFDKNGFLTDFTKKLAERKN